MSQIEKPEQIIIFIVKHIFKIVIKTIIKKKEHTHKIIANIS